MTALAQENARDTDLELKFEELIAHLESAMRLAVELRDRARQSGDSALIAQSEQLVRSTRGAATDYNASVADRPVDDEVVRQARRIEIETEENESALAQLVRQLQLKVDKGHKALGIEVDAAGNVTFVDGGLARSAHENHTVLHGDENTPGLVRRVEILEERLEDAGSPQSTTHQVREDDDRGGLDQMMDRDQTEEHRVSEVRSGPDFDNKKALTAFVVVAIIAFLFGWLWYGFVPGLVIGVCFGAAAAIITALSTRNDTARAMSREERMSR